MLRDALRQQISRHIDENNLVVDTATADGSTNTLVCSRLQGGAVDHWADGELLCVTGANAGLARTVIGSSAGVVRTVDFPQVIVSGDAFELRREGPFAGSINTTINEALEALANWHYVPYVDTSVNYVSGTAEYALPAAFVLLYGVEYESSGAGKGDWTTLSLAGWTTVQGAAKLRLTNTATSVLNSAGQPLRLLGYRSPASLSNDTTPPDASSNYLIAYAVAKLLGNYAGGPAVDPDAHAQRQNFWTQLANVERRLMSNRRMPTCRRIKW